MLKGGAQLEAYFVLFLMSVISLVVRPCCSAAPGLGDAVDLCSPTHVIASNGHFSIDDLMEICFVLAGTGLPTVLLSPGTVLLLRKTG